MNDTRLLSGSPAHRALSRSMFLYGFAMFMLVYMAQPLMPRYVAEFGVSPAQASHALSAATAGLALFLIPAALWTDRVGRKPVLVGGLVLCGLLSSATFWVTSFDQFVAARFVFGICLAALPATALAYLGEEMAPTELGRTIGLYIAGNALGGMSGRLLALTLSEWMNWRTALALMGVLALGVAAQVYRALPPSRHFVAASDVGQGLRSLRLHLADPGLPWLFVLAFLLSGSVVSVYNYISFRLSASPHFFSQYALCAVYALYLSGMVGSSRVGALADRLGRARVLWWCPLIMALGLFMTLSDTLLLLMGGMAVMTFGFFAGHSVASSWVSRRALHGRALASSLYLTMYYLGASVLGTASGRAWSADGWRGVALVVAGVLTACLAISLRLRHLKPLSQP